MTTRGEGKYHRDGDVRGRYASSVAELRAPSPGTVIAVFVDEGTLVAEEDELLTIEGSDGVVVLAAVIPGVLREWYVEPGSPFDAGTVLALIDES